MLLLGKTAQYNHVATWACANLPKFFRPNTTAQSFVVKTAEDCKKPSAHYRG
jgi:indolepyruvate decarboxylase